MCIIINFFNGLVALSYCIIKVKNNKEQKPNDIIGEEKLTSVSDEELITMKKVTDAIFYVVNPTDNLKLEDIEKYKLLAITYSLGTGFLFDGFNDSSLLGSQLKEIFKKYFNSDLELVPIPCFITEHPNLYIYNSVNDKYELSEEHKNLGHSSERTLDVKVKYVDSGSKGNTYLFILSISYDRGL